VAEHHSELINIHVFNRTTTPSQLTSVNLTVPPIGSLVANDLGGVRTVYIGNTDGRIQVVENANGSSSATLPVQTIPAPRTNPSPIVSSFTDGTTYVAFLNRAGILIRYPLLATGLLNISLGNTTTNQLNTSVVNAASVVQLPNVIIAGSTTVSVVNMATFTVTVNPLNPVTRLGTSFVSIICGTPATSNYSIIYYATSANQIITYDVVNNNILYAVQAAFTMSNTCGSRLDHYALFVSTTTAPSRSTGPQSIYQYSYSRDTSIISVDYTVDNVGVSGQIPAPAVTNSDNSAMYFVMYTPGGSVDHLDTIYEFRLRDDTFDFNSVTQEDYVIDPRYSILLPFFQNPTVISTLVNNSVYIGANPQGGVARFYELLVPATYPADAANTTIVSHMVPDYTLPANPNGLGGKINSVADSTADSFGNQDIFFSNGVGSYPTAPLNTSTTFPARGATTTYIRGTQTEAPNHGGQINPNGISLKLISLDEVSTFNGLTLVKSLPILNSNEAPWSNNKDLYQFANGPNYATGTTWTIGITDSPTVTQYIYPTTPYARAVNGTVPDPPTKGKRYPYPGPNQYTEGYMSMGVTLTTYNTNATSATIFPGNPSVTYNISSRYLRYDFTVTNYPFLVTGNILRVQIAVGLGIDGNTSQGALVYGSNFTTTPVFPGYILLTTTADWTLLLPQKVSVNGNIFNAIYNCSYDPQTQIISAFLPYARNATLTYSLLLGYQYVAPPAPVASNQDGGGPKLLPLWIVIGVVGGILCIAVIVAIIVIIIVYKVAGDRIKEFLIDSELDKTKNALSEDRGAF